MEKKLGIYICSGCEIGKSIDMAALEKVGSVSGEHLCRTHAKLCLAESVQNIQEDIKKEHLEGVIVAACSPRFFTKEFSFNQLTERVNLRELVAWSHEAKDADTNMLAEDSLRMGLAKMKSILSPTPFIPDQSSSEILVIGGGISGITASIEAAKAGYKTILVEKNKLGGWSNHLHKQLPMHPPFDYLEKPLISQKIHDVKTQEKVEIHENSSIKEISGQPGEFRVVIKQEEKETKRKVASVVLATGWNPYDAEKLTEFGYGQNPNIITNLDFEKMAKAGPVLKPSDGEVPKQVLFIQCAGSRDKNHLPYCSNYCCGTSLKQALYIRESSKETSVFIVYKDIRTAGKLEAFYEKVQHDDQVFMTKGEIGQLNLQGDRILVDVHQTLLGDNIQLEVDLIVLAIGMTPQNTEDLNLKYRLGKGLPELKYEFADSHFICFPYESRRTGIYAAGSVRSPMDISSSMEDACGAMLKAIQCAEATKRGEAVHPRSGDLSHPEIYFSRCTDCKRCTEECPFGTYDENEKGTPIPNPSRCRRCGICMGACPERVISFEDFNVNAISEMIKAVEIPDEFEEKPRILAFVCENDAYPAFDMAGQKRLKYSPHVRIIPVRCLGSVNNIWISDALSKGFDGILQIGCKPGDDYQCHFINGSDLTEKRGENIQEVLEKMMLENERIKTVFVEINEYDKIPRIIDDYVEEIELIGPNPFKDM
ncbi:MAG: hydrogenase iron-sulfur subunit [Bacteroidetes bacterium]|nr:hydrogenase iron-sulfur subunit [Bacteroidota bacterium]